MKNTLKNIKSNLLGNQHLGNLRNQIYKVACLIALFASLVGLAFNLLLNLSVLFSLSIAFISLSYATFYFYARFKKQYFNNLFLLVSQIGLALSWYSEGGLSGPVVPLFVLAIIVFTAMADQKWQIYYLFISIANVIGLFLLEQSDFNKNIIQYHDKLSHDLDITFTLVVAIISLFLFVSYIKMIFLKNFEKTRNQKKELEKLNEIKDKFFSIIAHDLRVPFNGMVELTRLMSDEATGLSKEDLQDLSGKLSQSAKNTLSLLENLLSWAKLNQGMIPYKPKPIQLKEFTSLHMETIQDMANRKEISTENNIPNDLMVFADEYMLQTIIRNFLINAIKFTYTAGNVSINATIKNETQVEISITDNGVGMNQKIIDNLFLIDNEYRRAGTENESSSGLGLILCQEFIKQHHGTIKVESQEGKGSSFRFTLPRYVRPTASIGE